MIALVCYLLAMWVAKRPLKPKSEATTPTFTKEDITETSEEYSENSVTENLINGVS